MPDMTVQCACRETPFTTPLDYFVYADIKLWEAAIELQPSTSCYVFHFALTTYLLVFTSLIIANAATADFAPPPME